MQISVIGLGKVGLTLASCLADVGHCVVAVDIDADLVDGLNDRRYDSPEPGVAERLERLSPGTLVAMTDLARAVRQSEVTFVVVPTPSNELGGFSLRYLLPACDTIGAAVKGKATEHTVAVVSTVLPGSSDSLLVPTLESASGRRIGDGLHYCYNPSFIALGEVVKGMVTPDYLLIGQSDKHAGDVVLSVHKSMVTNQPPEARMSPVEAEITKIASNTHETMRVSFANMLFSVCSEVPGADVDRVTEALAHRMGRRFFKGAVPYGGPCWPRDNRAFSVFLDAVGTPSTLPKAIDTFNAEHGRYVLRRVLAATAPGDTVGLLGLAYKPGTPVIERAFGVDLAEWLAHDARKVIGWDPLATDEARRVLGGRIEYAESAEACLRASNVAVVTIPNKELRTIDWTAAAGTTLIDCWRCLPPTAIAACREYVALGRTPPSDVADWLAQTTGGRFPLLTT